MARYAQNEFGKTVLRNIKQMHLAATQPNLTTVTFILASRMRQYGSLRTTMSIYQKHASYLLDMEDESKL